MQGKLGSPRGPAPSFALCKEGLPPLPPSLPPPRGAGRCFVGIQASGSGAVLPQNSFPPGKEGQPGGGRRALPGRLGAVEGICRWDLRPESHRMSEALGASFYCCIHIMGVLLDHVCHEFASRKNLSPEHCAPSCRTRVLGTGVHLRACVNACGSPCGLE